MHMAISRSASRLVLSRGNDRPVSLQDPGPTRLHVDCNWERLELCVGLFYDLWDIEMYVSCQVPVPSDCSWEGLSCSYKAISDHSVRSSSIISPLGSPRI